MSENIILTGATVLIAWNAWISLALIKIMIDTAIIKKKLNGEIDF